MILQNNETAEQMLRNKSINGDIKYNTANLTIVKNTKMDTIKYPNQLHQQPNQAQSSVPKKQLPSNHYNLFLLQSRQENLAPISHKARSKSFRKITIKKTPSEIIKQGILKNRQSKRTEQLKSITRDNIKLFLRLQSQRSQYNLTKLHKQLSCSILPLAKSKMTNQTLNSKVEMTSIDRSSRCSSAAPSLKFRCKSLRHNLKSSNSTSRTLNIISNHEQAQISGSRAIPKICLIDKDKENIIVNKQLATLNDQQQQILMRKIGMAIPSGKQKRTKKLNQKIGSLNFTIKSRRNDERVVLGERQNEPNAQE